MNSEPILLNAIPGKTENDRLALFLIPGEGTAGLALCQQSWADGIGWFTQSKVQVDPDQVASLRQALGQGGSGKVRPAGGTLPTQRPMLRVVG
jgi:hypothetical protein